MFYELHLNESLLKWGINNFMLNTIFPLGRS